MTDTYKVREKSKAAPKAPLEAWWRFQNLADGQATDVSSGRYVLTATGNPQFAPITADDGAVILDGQDQWLGTSKPVLRTDQSFSIAAWVRLDSRKMNNGTLKPGDFAITAVSQDSPSHSAFYLGARAFEEEQADGSTRLVLRWNFTVSPVDGSVTGLLEWRHAASSRPIDASMLDRWVLLVGVCDVEGRILHLYVPGLEDSGSDRPPPEWTFWHAEDGLQIGRARWLGDNVDLWPGSVGAVRAYSGVLTAEDAANLHAEDEFNR